MANFEALRVARAMAEPVRLAILERLVNGPATVADLVAATGATQPNVSNHLAVLREANLVRAVRKGRTAVYRLRGPEVSSLMRSFSRAAGGTGRRPSPSHPLTVARTCYDHVAGDEGVIRNAAFEGCVIKGPAVVVPQGCRIEHNKFRGEADAIRRRLEALWEAGADHVALIPVGLDGAVADHACAKALAPRVT
jgi:DNA-binding transcriptional ArsR family regulator